LSKAKTLVYVGLTSKDQIKSKGIIGATETQEFYDELTNYYTTGQPIKAQALKKLKKYCKPEKYDMSYYDNAIELTTQNGQKMVVENKEIVINNLIKYNKHHNIFEQINYDQAVLKVHSLDRIGEFL
jgi:hypothetical protein